MSATSLAPICDPDDIETLLASAAAFRDLPPQVRRAIAEISYLRNVSAQETILAFGQFDGEEFFLVSSGRLKAAYASASHSVMIEHVSAGEFFGLADAVCASGPEVAEKITLTAEEASTIVSIDAAAFRDLAAQKPSLARNLMREFAQRLCLYGFRNVVSESPVRRVFAALMEHVARDPLTGEWRVERMPKHRELADQAGTDETVAANAIAKLIQDGVARREYPGLIIVDMAELGRLAS